MVDLHQPMSGLPDGHPWLALSRWGIVWRAALGLITTGLAILLVWALIDLGSSDPTPEAVLGLVWFGLPQLLVFAGVAAWLGPRLRRYYPFGQALLFGGAGVAASALIAVPIEIGVRVFTPDPWGSGLFLVLLFAGFPFFLTGATGYGLAIWSVTRRGARVFWPMLAAVVALYLVCWTLAVFGP